MSPPESERTDEMERIMHGLRASIVGLLTCTHATHEVFAIRMDAVSGLPMMLYCKGCGATKLHHSWYPPRLQEVLSMAVEAIPLRTP